jgi:hypothetical protein
MKALVTMDKLTVLVLISSPLAFGFAPRAPLQLSRSPIQNWRLFSATAPVEQASTDSVFDDDKSHRFLGQPIPYEQLTIGVLKEVTEGEARVSQTPETVANLVKKGFHVLVEAGGESTQSLNSAVYQLLPVGIACPLPR